MTLPRIECEQIDRFKASYSQQFGLDEKILKVTHHKFLDNIQHGVKHCFRHTHYIIVLKICDK